MAVMLGSRDSSAGSPRDGEEQQMLRIQCKYAKVGILSARDRFFDNRIKAKLIASRKTRE